MSRILLEIRSLAAVLVVVVVSLLLLLPGILFPALWKKLQNPVVDWADEWGFKELRQRRHLLTNEWSDFTHAVRVAIVSGWKTEEQFCETYNVSIHTVRRWRTGVDAPPSEVRALILADLNTNTKTT